MYEIEALLQLVNSELERRQVDSDIKKKILNNILNKIREKGVLIDE